MTQLTVGVLALQGSFAEHVNLLKSIKLIDPSTTLEVIQVRDEEDLEAVTALIIPGGESTAISLIAQRTKMIEPLRKFVQRAKSSEQGYSVWGTCAGMILLGEQVLGGQLEGAGTERFGGMDVKVVRNQWGRQSESFVHPLNIPVISTPETPFTGIFIRAPVLHSFLAVDANSPPIEVLARVPIEILPVPKVVETAPVPATTTTEGEIVATRPSNRLVNVNGSSKTATELGPEADIVMLRQGGLLVSSFHPELTNDLRVHEWWVNSMCSRKQ